MSLPGSRANTRRETSEKEMGRSVDVVERTESREGSTGCRERCARAIWWHEDRSGWQGGTTSSRRGTASPGNT